MTRHNKTFSSTLFALLLGSSFLLGATANGQTMEEAKTSILSYSPAIASAKANLERAREAEKKVKHDMFPQLTIRSSLTKSHRKSRTTSLAGHPSGKEKTIRDSSIELRQSLFSGFSDKARLESAAADHHRAKAQLVDAVQSALSRGIDSYLAVIEERQVLDSIISAEKFSRQILAIRNNELAEGSIAKEQQIAALRTANDNAARVAAQRRRLARANGNFMRYVGSKPQDLEFAYHSEANLPQSLEDAIAAANQNASVTAGNLQAEMRNANADIRRSAIYPKIDAVISYSKDNDSFIINDAGNDITTSDSTETEAGIQLQWRISGGTISQADARSERARALSERMRAQNTLRTVLGRVIDAWETHQNAMAEVASLEQVVQLERQQNQIAIDKIATGGGTEIAALNQSMRAERTRQRLVRARMSQERAKVRLLGLVNAL